MNSQDAEDRIDKIDTSLLRVKADIAKLKKAQNKEALRAALQYELRLKSERQELLQITQ